MRSTVLTELQKRYEKYPYVGYFDDLVTEFTSKSGISEWISPTLAGKMFEDFLRVKAGNLPEIIKRKAGDELTTSESTSVTSSKFDPKDERLDEIKALKKTGLNNVQIASKIGVTEATIRRRLKKII